MRAIVIPECLNRESSFAVGRLTAWIPAFAGMTAFGLCLAGAAHGYTLDQVLERLEQKEKNMTSLKFDFKQDIHFLEGDLKASAEGEALFAKMGKMKIVKKKPEEQWTVSNGKKVWMYTPGYNQVWTGTLKDWTKASLLPQGFVPFHNYVNDLKKGFSLSLKGPSKADAGASTVRLRAVPKEADLGYELELVLSTESWLLSQTIFTSGSARVVTTLSKLEVNPFISEPAFEFKPPAGTDVIPLN